MISLLVIYSLLNFMLFFLFGKIAYKVNLVDQPNRRKIHSQSTAYTGGIAISVALILSILIFNVSNYTLNLILSIGFLISLVGLIDDKFSLTVGGKLSLLIIPIFYLIIHENIVLNNIGNYDYFKIELGAFAVPFTLCCILFLINAFNYFDGVDGLLGFSSISVLGILYFLVHDQNLELFIIIIFITIIIFLFFNFSLFRLPKIFLGDSGSLLIGFIISFTLIYLANKQIIHPILLAWVISIFVFEFLSINFIRLINKKNPFKPGKDHMHHIIIKKTKSVFLTNFFITSVNIIFFMIGYSSFLYINPFASLILFVMLYLFFFVLRYKYSK